MSLFTAKNVFRIKKKKMNENNDILSFIYDQSGMDKKFLHMEHFFDYPYLVELNLSNNQLWSLPLSISNCILLERVDISNNPMSRPPLVLFSLPRLRTNPRNIIFGNNQECTEELAREIMKETYKLNHCFYTFRDFDSSTRIVSFPPDVTTLSLLKLLHPECANLADYIVFVRTYKKYVLRIIPEDVPASLYFIPNAEWSFEIKYLPPFIPFSILPLLKQYIFQQYEKSEKSKELEATVQFVKSFNSNDPSQLFDLVKKLEDFQQFCSRKFTAELDTQVNHKLITLYANADGVSLYSSGNSYFTFHPRTISFDYIEEITSGKNYFLLTCGNRALLINKSSLPELMILLSYTTPEMPQYTKKKQKNFLDIPSKTTTTYRKSKNPSLEHLNKVEKDKLDNILNSLRSF